MLDMDAGSRFLGECAIGTNYDIRQYTRNTLFDEKIGGTCHFALGAGYPKAATPTNPACIGTWSSTSGKVGSSRWMGRRSSWMEVHQGGFPGPV